MKIAAIIPARKGSKRIPNKNQYKIEGELGIQKVLNNLGNTKYVNDVFLSTDDEYLIENTKIEYSLIGKKTLMMTFLL